MNAPNPSFVANFFLDNLTLKGYTVIILNGTVVPFKTKRGIMRTKSRDIKDAIKSYIEKIGSSGGNCPSYSEISGVVGTSKSNVCRYMAEMESDGELVQTDYGYITDKMDRAASDTQTVPVLGSIPCGPLEEETECIEGYYNLPTSFIGHGEHYLLRASGDSMVNAGIDDGDLVLIRKQNEAEDGDIVVALAENLSTLKRLYRDDERKCVVLHPENDYMDDIIVKDCYIQGVAVKIIKDIKK